MYKRLPKVVIHFVKTAFNWKNHIGPLTNLVEIVCAGFSIDSFYSRHAYTTDNKNKTSNIASRWNGFFFISFLLSVLLHDAFSWCEYKTFVMSVAGKSRALVEHKHETMYCKLPIHLLRLEQPFFHDCLFYCCFPSVFLFFDLLLLFCFK